MHRSSALHVQYAARAARHAVARASCGAGRARRCADDAQVTLRIVGAREGRALNRDFRGKDYATNVLTFAYASGAPLTGDIVLCAPVVRAKRGAQGKTLDAHYAHLVVHGVLHLQGYDHEHDARGATRWNAGDPTS